LGSLLGVVLGPAVVLTLVVSAIVWIGRHSRPIGLILSVFVIIGTLSAIAELILVLRWRTANPYEPGWNGVLFAEAVVALLFVRSLVVLYRELY
jgi:hypothetical protein